MSNIRDAYRRRYIYMIVPVLLLAGLNIVACTSEQPTVTSQTTPTALLTPTIGDNKPDSSSNDPTVALVRDAFANMINVETLHFEVKDNLPAMPFNVFPTEGDYMRPDKARGIIHKNNEIPIEWIKSGQLYFTRSQGSTSYVLAGSPAPDGVFLDFGLLANIEPYIKSATVGADEEIDGVTTKYIEVLYDIKAFPRMVAIGSKGLGRIDIWVDEANKYIHKLGISAWTEDTPVSHIFYSKFNEPLSAPIENPIGK